MSIKDFIKKDKKEEVVLTSVEINKELYKQVKLALDLDSLTMRQIVEAGLKAYLEERKNEKK